MTRVSRRGAVMSGRPAAVSSITNGQQINASNTGRAGAAAAAVANYASTLTTIATVQTYSTTQTIRNTRFTAPVDVTGGTVMFEFCQFVAQPAAAAYALRIYNGGAASGAVTLNWCDVDSGLRGASAGNNETTGFQAGERGPANPPTSGSAFTLYRCGIQGYGNDIGMHKWYSSGSTITECYLDNVTGGASTHPDAIELYSSGNVTVQRCRMHTDANFSQSILNVATAFGDVPGDGAVAIRNNYINEAWQPVLADWFTQGGSTHPQRNISFVGMHGK